MSTLFRNALLVELDPPAVNYGDLRAGDGVIVSAGLDLAPQPGDEIVDCGGAVLTPGLVNGHTHLYSALAAGMPAPPRAPRNFHEILELIWWRLDRAHRHESVLSSGEIGALAALRCGATTLVDHHASPDCIEGSLTTLQQGIEHVGCRGVLCYEVTDRNRPTEAAEGLAETERYAQTVREANHHRFAAMVGAHASFTLREESLRGCVELARGLNLGVHIHVAEDPVDEQITLKEHGCSLTERFDRTGLLSVPGAILAHGTHLREPDFAMLADHREELHLAHNPSSNMNNGVGYTPVAHVPLPVLLGTDGIAADMWREARTAEFKSHDAQNPMPFGASLAMLAESARVASRALGVTLGSLQPGAAADLVVTRYKPATPLTAENLAGHFLFAMGPEWVRHVMIAGKWCLRDGEVVSCDEGKLRSDAQQRAKELWSRMSL